MATIVRMPAPAPRRAVQAETQSGATILFFTGVRYEREEEPETADEADGPDFMSAVPALAEATACLAL